MCGVTRMKEVRVALLQTIRISKGRHKNRCSFLKDVIMNTSEAKCVLKSLRTENDALGKCPFSKVRYCEMGGR
jgi:hypothetical protein